MTQTLTYLQLKEQQQNEVNEFPLGFAFGNEQFKKMKIELPLKEGEKYLSLGAGCFVRESDYEKFDEMLTRQRKDLMQAIERDTTGENFILKMFSYELANHEYGYSGDLEPTLDALGLTLDEINASQTLKHGLNLARKGER